jgi:uncharacterized membrane protein YgcG
MATKSSLHEEVPAAADFPLASAYIDSMKRVFFALLAVALLASCAVVPPASGPYYGYGPNYYGYYGYPGPYYYGYPYGYFGFYGYYGPGRYRGGFYGGRGYGGYHGGYGGHGGFGGGHR